jgi:hypothetical protein
MHADFIAATHAHAAVRYRYLRTVSGADPDGFEPDLSRS